MFVMWYQYGKKNGWLLKFSYLYLMKVHLDLSTNVYISSSSQETDIDKMEKAEILEKTLEVLTRLRSDHSKASRSGASAHKAMAVRYANGFTNCAEESIRYIQSSRLVPSEVKVHLQTHLRTIAHRQMETVVQVESPYAAMATPLNPTTTTTQGESRGYCMPSPIQSSTPVSHQLNVHPYQCDAMSNVQSSDPSNPNKYILPVHKNSAFVKLDYNSCSSTVTSDNVPVQSSTPQMPSYAEMKFKISKSPSKQLLQSPVESLTNSYPDQTVYKYCGYEPYAVTPNNQSSSISYDSNTSPQTPHNAINLCTKQPTQISPESMWRPW